MDHTFFKVQFLESHVVLSNQGPWQMIHECVAHIWLTASVKYVVFVLLGLGLNLSSLYVNFQICQI